MMFFLVARYFEGNDIVELCVAVLMYALVEVYQICFAERNRNADRRRDKSRSNVTIVSCRSCPGMLEFTFYIQFP